MTFQLRRMLLVNAGTNKHVPSGRITELDPRGGAAVVGGNAVGKTSTLRLIPLFFGHPVSQVVAMHQGQEGVRFILPTMTSAICFEYQRGSDRAEDIRLVVMRARADGSDAAEYRIYETAFLTELFVKDGRFLTDDGTEERAQSLGIKGTSKLATADYRSVILRSGFHTKDHKRLYSYALTHSFGPRSLPNLDKLVATMVKNGVKFEELVQVAVGLIQDDLSGDAQRHTLKMRQQRKHIEAWLCNRDAAEEALKLQPRINELSGLCLDHRTLETEWRHRHADVDATIAARTQEGNGLQEQLAEADKQREATIATEKVAGDALAESARKASETASAAKHAYETAQGQQNHYETEKAEHWSRELVRLEPLERERRALQQQVSAAELVAESANLEYTKRKGDVERDAAAARDRLEAGKKPHHDQYDAEVKAIGAMETSVIDTLDFEAVGKREAMAVEHGELLTKRGEWQARVDNPAVPAELEEAVTNASNQVIENGRKLTRETVQLSDAAKELHRAQNEFDACERTLERVVAQVKECERQVANARAVLHPENGTLLSALRAHSDDQWKRDLARVLNPELLQRTDLNPHALPEGLAESAYGWSLETRIIVAPGWTDDSVMRESVAQAEANLSSARQVETTQREEHKRRSDALTAAREKHTNLEAQTSVTTAQGKVLKDAMEQARERVRLARNGAKRDVETQLQAVNGKLRELNQHAKSLEARMSSERTAIRQEHEAQRQAALKRRNDAISNIDANIKEVISAAAEQVKSLEKQLAAHLSEKGVDVKALEELKTKVGSLDEQITQLTQRKPMVEAWKTWVVEVGPTKVAALRQEATRLAETARQASTVLEEHNRKCEVAQRAHNEAVTKLRARAEEVSTEMDILAPLKELFGSYAPQRHDGFDTTTKATELRRLVRNEAKQLEEQEASIKRLYTELHRLLTSRESTVKQLVDASLAGHAGSDIAKANELLLAYRRLPSQVLSELNNTLQTVLGQIGHFRKSIVAFEDEVRRFNTQLQKALNEVERFDRVDQLRLDIVADFEGLGFYKKLKRMDDVVRQHQGDRVLDYLRDMPPAATAEALRDFMSVIGTDGTLEVNLASHITLHGSVVENGTLKSFKRASELENVSSTGLTTLILITLLVGLVNVVRRGESVHVPWVTDEVGRFDASNFAALLKMLADNRIDVITAAPQLGMAEQAHFANRYLFADRGEIRRYAEPSPSRLATPGPVTRSVAEGVRA